MESLYRYFLQSLEIFAITIGGLMVIIGFMHIAAGNKNAMIRILFGAALVITGVVTPSQPTNQLPPVDKQFLNRVA